MDKDGLQQVEDRLAKLRIAASFIAQKGDDLPAKESAWFDFLQFHGTLYSKLEQAAKSDKRSAAWFKDKKELRKTDPLLIYLQHARNAGEHTIQRTSTQATFAVSGTSGGGEGGFGISFDAAGKPYPVVNGDIANVRVLENEIILAVAVDRGKEYLPPKQHLGQEIDGQTARSVAMLALVYFEGLVSEARQLLQ